MHRTPLSTGLSRRREGRSQSDSQSMEDSGDHEAELLPWRRFSQPATPAQAHPQPSTSDAPAPIRLHHSTDSGRVFGGGGGGSGDGATASSTPGTAHRSLLSPSLPCEHCGWAGPWTRGISPHSGSVEEAASSSLSSYMCEFRVVRLGAAKLGWSVDSDPWAMPMIGFTNSGRRLYSITEDGREFLLEGWVVREGDRLTCKLDMRRRFASWCLNEMVIESRSDLPAALSGYGVQPTVWESEADLEVRVSRGSQALSLLMKAAALVPSSSGARAEAPLVRPTASRASSATSGDSSHPDRRSTSRHSSVERALAAGPCPGEESEVEVGEEAGEGASDRRTSGELPEESEVLEPGVTRAFLTTESFPFVETLATRIPSCSRSSGAEVRTTKIPFIETRRCVFPA